MGDVQDDDGTSVFIHPVANAPARSAADGILPGILILQRMADVVRNLAAAVATFSGNRAS